MRLQAELTLPHPTTAVAEALLKLETRARWDPLVEQAELPTGPSNSTRGPQVLWRWRYPGRLGMVAQQSLDGREVFFRLDTGPIWLRTFSEDWTLTPSWNTQGREHTQLKLVRVVRLNSLYLEKLVEPFFRPRMKRLCQEAATALNNELLA